MRINIDIDTAGLVAKTAREERRLAYNTAEALNNTAKAAQAAIRTHMLQVFKTRADTKRDRKWLLEQIKVLFSSVKKGIMYAEVYVNPKPKNFLLAKFEGGDERTPFVGTNLGVPNPAQARVGGAFAGALKPGIAFNKLGLKKVFVVPRRFGDRTQFKGKDRTFLLKHTSQNPLGGVYQRVGPGKDDIRLIYSFRRAFKLHQLLQLVKTATTTMQDKFKVEWVIANARNPSK
jgi:hypothetical protein